MILKQSRPWVEKYDQIPAPFDRALVEQRFYRRIAEIPDVASSMPKLLGADEESRTLLLEDLGDSQDLTSLYRGAQLGVAEVLSLGAYLRALHQGTRRDSGVTDSDVLRNREMRALNHEHIYRVPLKTNNGVPLQEYEPGLEEVAELLRGDRQLLAAVAHLGERYLEDGPCLVHGDFFPGSWLQSDDRGGDRGLRVIDPEFCFYGDPELDLGVATAHFALAQQSFDRCRELIDSATDRGAARPIDEGLLARYAGIEVIRRLIGVAQLPLPPTDGFRGRLLERARVTMLKEALAYLWHSPA